MTYSRSYTVWTTCGILPDNQWDRPHGLSLAQAFRPVGRAFGQRNFMKTPSRPGDVPGVRDGVTAANAVTFASVNVSLISGACLAAYIPARRATKVDQMAALRHE